MDTHRYQFTNRLLVPHYGNVEPPGPCLSPIVLLALGIQPALNWREGRGRRPDICLEMHKRKSWHWARHKGRAAVVSQPTTCLQESKRSTASELWLMMAEVIMVCKNKPSDFWVWQILVACGWSTILILGCRFDSFTFLNPETPTSLVEWFKRVKVELKQRPQSPQQQPLQLCHMIAWECIRVMFTTANLHTLDFLLFI